MHQTIRISAKNLQSIMKESKNLPIQLIFFISFSLNPEQEVKNNS